MKGEKVLTVVHSAECWPSVDRMAPCEQACPLNTDVPSYVMAIGQGKLKEALAVIRETNPFPSICGRVCHHPCETECNRVMVENPISIMSLKRVAADQELKEGIRKPRPARRTKKEKVAIIGSGPAGLTAAYDLVKAGYGVTVFEAGPVAGGMLATGIPEFVLPQKIVQAEIQYIKDLGVEIKTNTPIGKGLTIEDLKGQGYNAILIASGAWRSLPLNIPGANLEGVIPALSFLKETKVGDQAKLRKPTMSGKVVVIGGGNVAMDAARTALRLGAKEVHLFCLESKRQMPAFPWEIEATKAEGVILHPSQAPLQFVSKDGKKVSQVDFQAVARFERDKEGRIKWTLAEGADAKSSIEADSVIVAIGQGVDASAIGNLGIDLSPRKSVVVDEDTMATNISGIFAAGDIVDVVGTVTGAMAAGRKAAVSINRFLQGKDLKKGRARAAKPIMKAKEEMVPLYLLEKPRWEMPSLASQDAIRTFAEAKLGYTDWEGIEEAKRCLNCRMCGSCIFERQQLCYERSTKLLYT